MQGNYVGKGGQGIGNYREDVVLVQALLNTLTPDQGKALTPLKLDGYAGPKTIAAIELFQRRQFGKSDGRVDAKGPSLKKLEELESSPLGAPALAFAASQKLARQWVEAATVLLRPFAFCDENTGVPEADKIPYRTRQLLWQFFRSGYPPFARSSQPGGQYIGRATITHLNRVYFGADKNLQRGFYTPVRQVQLGYDLTQPQSIPLSTLHVDGGEVGMAYSFVFCEPDAANGIGQKEEFRAAALMQSALEHRAHGLTGPHGITVPLLDGYFNAFREFAYCVSDSGTFLLFAQRADLASRQHSFMLRPAETPRTHPLQPLPQI